MIPVGPSTAPPRRAEGNCTDLWLADAAVPMLRAVAAEPSGREECNDAIACHGLECWARSPPSRMSVLGCNARRGRRRAERECNAISSLGIECWAWSPPSRAVSRIAVRVAARSSGGTLLLTRRVSSARRSFIHARQHVVPPITESISVL